MINPISHATQAQSAPQPARQPAPPAKAQPTPTDTVHISQAAQAARAIIQEVTESQAQTTREAAAGDVQARTLLSREAAARKG